MLGALASILGLEGEQEHYATEEDVQKLMDQIKDPVGTFYMYSLPSSILRRKVMKQ
jgi:F420-non-reducing hydrogenase small subunit